MKRVLVISPGGMGCTFTLEVLRRAQIETNDPYDADGLKHHWNPRDPRYQIFAPAKTVYVWNDPLAALLSISRRGWLDDQAAKLGTKASGKTLSLRALWFETSRAHRDTFGLERHVDLWVNMWPPSLFFLLDFRLLHVQLSNLADFLERERHALDDLRVHKRAQYDLRAIPSDVIDVYRTLDLKVRTICERWS